jgi:hypothetical protein
MKGMEYKHAKIEMMMEYQLAMDLKSIQMHL